MKRIKKSLYYSKLPVINCLSLPVTGQYDIVKLTISLLF